jgi:hypothetical protein
MSRELFLNLALPSGIVVAAVVYVLVTGWFNRRAEARAARGHAAE